MIGPLGGDGYGGRSTALDWMAAWVGPPGRPDAAMSVGSSHLDGSQPLDPDARGPSSAIEKQGHSPKASG